MFSGKALTAVRYRIVHVLFIVAIDTELVFTRATVKNRNKRRLKLGTRYQTPITAFKISSESRHYAILIASFRDVYASIGRDTRVCRVRHGVVDDGRLPPLSGRGRVIRDFTTRSETGTGVPVARNNGSTRRRCGVIGFRTRVRVPSLRCVETAGNVPRGNAGRPARSFCLRPWEERPPNVITVMIERSQRFPVKPPN